MSRLINSGKLLVTVSNSMTPGLMYPFRFEPILKRYLWGGRRLGAVLGKSIGDENDYAESWEIVDREFEQSAVAFGSLAGKKISELLNEFGSEVLGADIWRSACDPDLPSSLSRRFPLLLKFLDAHRTLSVQVHPDDRMAAKLSPPDRGKTESWFVIDAEPGSVIYAGLKPGVDRGGLEQAVESQTTDQVLNEIFPQRGDCIFVPAGTIHAIGNGLLIAEIQQSSDTTFRLFDWNRVDANGNARPLHIEQAIEATDFSRGPVAVQRKKPTSLAGVQELVSCEKFEMRQWSIHQPRILKTYGRFRLLAVTAGAMNVQHDPAGELLGKGQSILVPACMDQLMLSPVETAEFLEITVP